MVSLSEDPVEFIHYRPTSAGGHGYIIVDVDYFTKWVDFILTYAEDGETVALFLFNHIIAIFGIPRAIVTDHGSHSQNKMMAELSTKLGFFHDNSTPYYPRANGQVEANGRERQVKLAFAVFLITMGL